jgi:hypothetical protein
MIGKHDCGAMVDCGAMCVCVCVCVCVCACACARVFVCLSAHKHVCVKFNMRVAFAITYDLYLTSKTKTV